jgi:hypothetical protein
VGNDVDGLISLKGEEMQEDKYLVANVEKTGSYKAEAESTTRTVQAAIIYENMVQTDISQKEDENFSFQNLIRHYMCV